MKKILLALSLLISLSASAQTITESGNPYDGVSGALVANNDAVRLNLRGTQWATVKFQAVVAGTATTTAQITTDGTNYFSSAYAKRLTTVSANPTTQAITATTLVAGDVWEVPLPSNAVAFQLLAGVGTSTTVKIVGGLPYVPGTPVTATLYDVTEGSIGAGIAAATFDLSGWASAFVTLKTPTTQVWAISGVADDGTNPGFSAVTTAAASSSVMLSQSIAANATATVPAGALYAYSFGDKRFALTLPAGGTVSTGRARVVVRR